MWFFSVLCNGFLWVLDLVIDLGGFDVSRDAL
jgi:hypothetical protein